MMSLSFVMFTTLLQKIRTFLHSRFRPECIEFIRNQKYSRSLFFSDLQAGLVLSLVSLPMAIAFGIASGVTPQQGIITAIVGGLIISFCGGSKVLIAGPAGAFIIIVLGVLAEFGESGLFVATMMAGIMLVIMGLLKLGSIVKLIPYPIVVGFTAGIAITLLSSQIKDFFGYQSNEVHSDFLSRWKDFFLHISDINIGSTIIGIITVLLIIYIKRITCKIPGSLVAVIFTTLFTYITQNFYVIDIFKHVSVIGDKYLIDSIVPKPSIPDFSFSTLQLLFPSAFTIAMLGAMESLLFATVVEGMTGRRHRSNTELVAQGLANITSPLFGGIPVTGSLARTVTSLQNGGKTMFAGVIGALMLLLIMLFMGKFAMLIPMPCLAGILFMIAYNMSEWRTCKSFVQSNKYDAAVLLTTLFLTLMFGLTVAIQVGLLMAVLIFLKRITESSNVKMVENNILNTEEEEPLVEQDTLVIAKGIQVYEINGPFFFGIANKLTGLEVDDPLRRPKVKIIRMRMVPFVDSTGARNLSMLVTKSQKDGIKIILSGVTRPVYKELKAFGVVEKIGKENIYDHISKAVAAANAIIESQKVKDKK